VYIYPAVKRKTSNSLTPALFISIAWTSLYRLWCPPPYTLGVLSPATPTQPRPSSSLIGEHHQVPNIRLNAAKVHTYPPVDYDSMRRSMYNKVLAEFLKRDSFRRRTYFSSDVLFCVWNLPVVIRAHSGLFFIFIVRKCIMLHRSEASAPSQLIQFRRIMVHWISLPGSKCSYL